MTRYFYTDPLAAAWMMFNQGLRIDGNSYSHIKMGEFCTKIEVFHTAESFAPKFYVHPDSLHLLQPVPGDIVQNPDEDVARVCDDDDTPFAGWVKLAVAKRWVGTEATIIQRGGKPFLWPESEAA